MVHRPNYPFLFVSLCFCILISIAQWLGSPNVLREGEEETYFWTPNEIDSSNILSNDTLIKPSPSSAGNNDNIHNQNINPVNESFSACLLIMDENFRLREWIAYHYHVLPLRFLIVSVDPKSKESPDLILEQFRKHLDMTILLWNESEYIVWGDDAVSPRQKLLIRQRRFLSHCLEFLYHQNRTWTALWDTDEYIVFNKYNFTRQHPTSGNLATSAIDMSKQGAIFEYLTSYSERNCIAMPRVLVGNQETPSIMNESHPLNPNRFDTLRFRYRGFFTAKENGIGKCMLNVQQIATLPIIVINPHRPVLEICPPPQGSIFLSSPFYLNHFVGSWEAYSYRDDSRKGREKSYEAYTIKSRHNRIYEVNILPWMGAFMEQVGLERGKLLLKDSGLDSNYNASHKIKEWKQVISPI
jgi:hypothetical protein